MKDDIIFKIVKQQVDAFDAYGLLKHGCPRDEFDFESSIIAGQIEKGMDAFSIATIMADVMSKQFDESFGVEEFLPYAERIKKSLQHA